MSDFTIVYSPPAYGDVIPQSECKHDPAGHLMPLGLEMLPVNPKKPKGRQYISVDGQLCMKCGWCWHVDTDTGEKHPARPGSADWWDIFHIAKSEFGGKCWQFASRLSVLAEEVGHLSRLLGMPQCRSQARAQSAHRISRHHTLRRKGSPRKRPALRFCFARLPLPFIAHRRGLPRDRKTA